MELKLFIEFITNSVKEINMDIEKLYSNKNNNIRKILDHLNGEVMMLESYIKYFSQITNQPRSQEMLDLYQNTLIQQIQGTNTFTLEELTQYNGKNGNPAYVAINGVVYDVTNNASWSTATHFGLSAGNDLTNAFSSCHIGSDILTKLPVVGKLIRNISW